RRSAGRRRCDRALRRARARGDRRVLRPVALARPDAQLDRAARRAVQHEPHADRVRRDDVHPGVPRSPQPPADRLRSTVLYAPELHEPLTKSPWSEAGARDAIQAIVADAERADSPDARWPAHEWDGDRAALAMKNLYVGAAGVVWGLNRLGSTLDLRAASQRALELFRAAPDYVDGDIIPEQRRSALLTGETGIALVAWQLDPTDELEGALLGL